ncbi:pentatricopeptide repeat-containing protein At5g66520-like [Nicotiana tomentosiformis]|uniref:pentatricopeptide repeat-containing protein At5g66520-like n=1 Tax=Nicotiana tomentosiformis TaxID=4098 RepID=UPI00051B9A69|nr:pentatricopeptide repeat-containing protein At5g66520-like [Nicotiana tomentosiformis]XP_009586649.1 pentatricopeptide repeat-containing protein At5g66520-like [Nicotiana tomentosiformis]
MIRKAVNETHSALTHFTQKCRTLNHLKELHCQLLKLYLPETPSAIAPLLLFVVNSGNPSFFNYSHIVFQNLDYQSTFLYNTMIRGYMQSDLPIPAVLCYKDMLRDKLIVNNYTFPPLIKACSMILNEFGQRGFSVHAHLLKLGLQHDRFIVASLIEFYSLNHEMDRAHMLFDEIPNRDVVMWTTMIDGYGKIGEVGKARLLFEEMPERNVISWSAMMAAYSRASDFKEVLCLYRRMEEDGLMPNESVLVSVLTACAHLGALAQGFWVHSFAKHYSYESNPILATALVDMYSKCGRMESASSVFEVMTYKDIGAWNAIISGFAMNGDAVKSVQLFNRMIASGNRPNETTFVSLLSACTHAEMVDVGLSLFSRMGSVYGVEPRFEHRACVVDLLARAGKLEDAEKFIEENMGGIEKGDANVWGALLGACRVYGNVEVGDRIWRKLSNMKVADHGTCVLAYNIYKEADRDIEAKCVRKLIEEMRIKKQPGCSVIEVNGIAEKSLASDLLHPK